MPRRPPQDPFTDAPLRPTTDNPSLRDQTSQQSLRSNASTASARPRQQRDLFAPALSRRPTSRTTPRVEDEVLADPDSEEEMVGVQQRQQLRRQVGKMRQGSPEGKHAKSSRGRHAEEEMDFVNRQADGGYLLGTSASNEMAALQMYAPELMIAKEDGIDGYYTQVARQYFTSGAALGGRGSKKPDDESETVVDEMIDRLRQQVTEKIETERWKYEPANRMHMGLP